MDVTHLLHQLTHNANRIAALATDVSDDQARWRPAADAWSILEVICHLLDEEREDFRVRLDITLHTPHLPWPPIDPQGWVSARAYNSRDLSTQLAQFLDERQASLRWLHSLAAPNWEAAYAAPWGSITAGDLFAAWAIHDTLHLRQLVELHYAYTIQAGRPYDPTYAGAW